MRRRLHEEHHDVRLVLPRLVARRDPGDEVEIPCLRRAAAARGLQQRVRREELPVAGPTLRVVSQVARRRPRDVDAAVVEEPFADGEVGHDRDREPLQLAVRADSRAQEDRRGEVRTGCEDDDVGLVEASLRVDDADRAIGTQDDPVDESVGQHGQVRSRTARVEVRERRVPACSVDDVRRERACADRPVEVVQVVEEREAERVRRLDEGDVEGTGRARVRGRGPQHGPRSFEEGPEALVRPAGAPLVVVRGRSLHDHARVHGRRASEDLPAERPPVRGPGSPEVRRRGRACVEDLRRPAALAQRPVVGAGLEQADAPVRVLAQSRREDASRRSATHDDDVEAHGPRIRRGRYPQRVSPLDVLSTPTRAWFERAFEGPTPAQALGWPAIATGGHVLIQAPTGSGKTLAAFLLGLDRLNETPGQGLRLLYVSPLKALNYDIERNLRSPLAGLGSKLQVGSADRRHTGRGAPPDAAHPARHPHHDARVALPPAHLAGARDAARRRDGDPRRGARGRGVEARVAPRALAGAPRAARRGAVPARRPLGDAASARGDRPVRGRHRARDRARRRGRPQGARPPGRRPRGGHARARLDRPSSPCRRSRTASRWASASSGRAARSGRRSTRRSSSSFARTARRSSS